MKKLKNFAFDQIKFRQVRMGCIGLTALILFGSLVLGRMIYPQFGMLMTMFLNGAALLFVGMAMREPMNRTARNLLLTGLAVCAWFVILQLSFPLVPGSAGPRFLMYAVPCEYLLLLPYAALAQEKEKFRGLHFLGWAYCLGSFLLTVIAAFMLARVPLPGLSRIMVWNKSYVAVSWLPNVLAGIFMVSIGLKLTYLLGKGRLWKKIAAGVLILPELFFLALTDSTTDELMTVCMVGACVFLALFKGLRTKRAWLRGGAAILAGVIAAGSLFLALQVLYKHHRQVYNADRGYYCNQLYEEDVHPTEIKHEGRRPSLPAAPAQVQNSQPAEPGAVRTHKALGGRLEIWSAAFRAIGANPRVLLFGSETVPQLLTQYREIPTGHSHNAWIQTLLQGGLVGLALACWVTWIAVKNALLLIFCRKSGAARKQIALLVLVILTSQFLEPYLFLVEYPGNFLSMVFLLLTGYLAYWVQVTPPVKEAKS